MARAQRGARVLGDAAADRGVVDECVFCGALCVASVAGGVRGLGVGTEGRVERIFLVRGVVALCGLRRAASDECRGRWGVAILRADVVRVRARADGEADARDVAMRIVAAGFLAVGADEVVGWCGGSGCAETGNADVAGRGEGAVFPTGGYLERGDVSRSAWRRLGVIGTDARRALGQCRRRRGALHREISAAGGSRRAVSTSRTLGRGQGCRGGERRRGTDGGGGLAVAPATVDRGGMVLVSRDAGARDWSRAGGAAIDGGSLYLSPDAGCAVARAVDGA